MSAQAEPTARGPRILALHLPWLATEILSIPGPVPAGEAAAALAPLPIDALRLKTEAMAGLRRLGLYRIGDVLAQPRAPLARRFGAGLSLMLDRATGAAPEPFRSIRPAPDRTVTLEFEEPLITRAAIDIAAEHLLARLCAQMAEEGQGLRQLRLRAHRAGGRRDSRRAAAAYGGRRQRRPHPRPTGPLTWVPEGRCAGRRQRFAFSTWPPSSG